MSEREQLNGTGYIRILLFLVGILGTGALCRNGSSLSERDTFEFCRFWSEYSPSALLAPPPDIIEISIKMASQFMVPQTTLNFEGLNLNIYRDR